jgi:hypothetical protein
VPGFNYSCDPELLAASGANATLAPRGCSDTMPALTARRSGARRSAERDKATAGRASLMCATRKTLGGLVVVLLSVPPARSGHPGRRRVEDAGGQQWNAVEPVEELGEDSQMTQCESDAWQGAVAAREALPECDGDAFSGVTKVCSTPATQSNGCELLAKTAGCCCGKDCEHHGLLCEVCHYITQPLVELY